MPPGPVVSRTRRSLLAGSSTPHVHGAEHVVLSLGDGSRATPGQPLDRRVAAVLRVTARRTEEEKRKKKAGVRVVR